MRWFRYFVVFLLFAAFFLQAQNQGMLKSKKFWAFFIGGSVGFLVITAAVIVFTLTSGI